MKFLLSVALATGRTKYAFLESRFGVSKFNDPTQKVPLARDGKELMAVVNLAPGKYEYKFVVDGQWRCSHDQAIIKVATATEIQAFSPLTHTIQDNLGNENNVVEVREMTRQSGDIFQGGRSKFFPRNTQNDGEFLSSRHNSAAVADIQLFAGY